VKTLALFVLLLPATSIAQSSPHTFRVASEVRAQYGYMPSKHGVKVEAGIRFETQSKKSVTYVLAGFKYNSKHWSFGPEARAPILGDPIEKYRFLLKAQLEMPSFIQ